MYQFIKKCLSILALSAICITMLACGSTNEIKPIMSEKPSDMVVNEPTEEPTEEPTIEPTITPTKVPTEEPTIAPTEEPTVKPANIEYNKITYKKLARNPDDYIDKYMKFTGEVIQVMKEEYEGDTLYTLRINMTKTDYGYDDTVMVYYLAPAEEDNILEDDIVTVKGYGLGEETYETVLGAEVTIPCIMADSIKIN